jgi:hypothetical protein
MGTLFVIQHRTFRTHAGVQCLLWSKSAVLIDPAASKETVMHHALGKQKNGDGQPNQKQELSNLEPGRLFPCRGYPIRILCHLSHLSAKPSYAIIMSFMRLDRNKSLYSFAQYRNLSKTLIGTIAHLSSI